MMDQTDMKFIEDLFRSLEGEMRHGFDEVRQEFRQVRQEFGDLKVRVTHMSDRMDRIGGLVNGRGRAIARIAEWSERSDVTTADLLHRVTDIDERLRKIEGQKGN